MTSQASKASLQAFHVTICSQAWDQAVRELARLYACQTTRDGSEVTQAVSQALVHLLDHV